ncbi:pseudouridine synthase [Clostridium frigidicarnis]|uniref:Pseudouridine synthase n=1 Tax=Clostridium frigidicarnis TaxID=84698 RepID=A0A1I0V4I9_9CLOT|nr:pseudouridine synthase [Clostridium frigidicarnis]SFA71244.1 ribosomal large subunit pseudouridine synthase B [Clostridium frigidicarnis]
MEERLQKYMARCGVASRRKCEEIILDGRVKVDGVVVTELGIKVNGNVSKVLLDDKEINLEEVKRYIMLNKPEGYITTVKDEKNRKTILDIVNVDERIYPIGRLDYDSSGLLLLTNDGDIYNNIIHPRSVIDKVYIAKVKGIFTDEEMNKFKGGVDIGGYITSDSNIEIIKTMRDTCKVKISIHEGKNRQIRKMCLALGHEVITLKRTAIGRLTLKDLDKGQWRELSLDEVNYLKNL